MSDLVRRERGAVGLVDIAVAMMITGILTVVLPSAIPNFQVTVVILLMAVGVIVAKVAGDVGDCRFVHVTADKASAPGPGNQLLRKVAE